MPNIQINSTDWNYTEKGRGLPLVFVHGFPLDQRVWSRQVDALADCCRVITVDLKGFGKSASTEAFTVDSMADQLRTFLTRINAIPCVLAGLSMGGYISLSFASRYPADLKALILVDSKSEADTPAGREGRQKMAELAIQQGAVPVAAAMMPKMFASATLQNRPELVQELQKIMEACPPTTIANASFAMRDRADYTEALKSMNFPTLIILGESDTIIPVFLGEKMKSLLPNGQLAVIPGGGHMPQMEQPDRVNAVLRQFVVSLT